MLRIVKIVNKICNIRFMINNSMLNIILSNLTIYYLKVLCWGLGIGDWAIPNPQSPIPTIKTLPY